jgi:hypothetical protein
MYVLYIHKNKGGLNFFWKLKIYYWNFINNKHKLLWYCLYIIFGIDKSIIINYRQSYKKNIYIYYANKHKKILINIVINFRYK